MKPKKAKAVPQEMIEGPAKLRPGHIQDRTLSIIQGGFRRVIVEALARPEAATYVYFIRAGDSGPVKIGVAANPYVRLEELQTGNPYRLRVIAAFVGGYPDEGRLHTEFKRERLEGEWFRASKRVLAEMARHRCPTMEEVQRSGGNQWKIAALHNTTLASIVIAARSEKNNCKPSLCRKERWEMVYRQWMQGETPQSADSFDLARDAVMAVLPPCRPRCTC